MVGAASNAYNYILEFENLFLSLYLLAEIATHPYTKMAEIETHSYT